MMFWYDHDMSGWGYGGMVIGMILSGFSSSSASSP